jgi:hypothetical protein
VSIHRIKDPDLRKVEPALRRAAAQARRTAAATHTPLVVCRNGKFIRLAVPRQTTQSAIGSIQPRRGAERP